MVPILIPWFYLMMFLLYQPNTSWDVWISTVYFSVNLLTLEQPIHLSRAIKENRTAQSAVFLSLVTQMPVSRHLRVPKPSIRSYYSLLLQLCGKGICQACFSSRLQLWYANISYYVYNVIETSYGFPLVRNHHDKILFRSSFCNERENFQLATEKLRSTSYGGRGFLRCFRGGLFR